MGKTYIQIGTYNDHHKEMTINGASVNVSELVKAFMGEEKPAGEPAAEEILPIPKQGKYTEVRRYIRERCRFDEEFKQYYQQRTLRELCTRLTKEFGWFVDEHSLGANLNRNR